MQPTIISFDWSDCGIQFAFDGQFQLYQHLKSHYEIDKSGSVLEINQKYSLVLHFFPLIKWTTLRFWHSNVQFSISINF